MARFSEVRAFDAGVGGVTAKTLMKLSAGTVIPNTATATDDPIGVATTNADEGNPVGVRFLCPDETQEIMASGAFNVGDKVVADADGKVSALPAAAGTYRQVGIALEAATADGDIVEILPYDFGATVTH